MKYATFEAARRRQDEFGIDVLGLGGGAPDTAVDSGVVEGVTQVTELPSSPALSISDQLRSGAFANSVPWGEGTHDIIAGAPPVATSSGVSYTAGAYVGNSDVLRSQQSDAVSYSPAAARDPALETGTMDWSKAFDAYASTTAKVLGPIATITQGLSRLAGIGAATQPGNPAPGGRPGRSYLQRLLSPGAYNANQPGTPAAGSALSASLGPLLVIGLVVGAGYLILRK